MTFFRPMKEDRKDMRKRKYCYNTGTIISGGSRMDVQAGTDNRANHKSSIVGYERCGQDRDGQEI